MIELLAPAGDLEKLKIAVMYGANAVFIGGQEFSLRSRASNFTIEDIKEGCDFAHAHNAFVHVTTNIIPHNDNLEGLVEYLQDLEKAGVDAIICASLYIIDVALKNTKLDVHVSTQQSVCNREAIAFYEKLGVKRVVLAREVTLEEMKEIKQFTNIEIETFIHGGMCSSYSGRCMLSNEMALRDANRGGCAHSCRWNYDLYDGTDKINQGDYFSLASKDLCALKHLGSLIDMGMDSLKIEGRMKSIHYIATVVNAYRRAIDEYYAHHTFDLEKFDHRIKKTENRLTSIGFYEGIPSPNEQLYINFGESPTQEFVGLVLGMEDDMMIIEERNYFTIQDTLEVFSPSREPEIIHIEEMLDKDNNKLEVARHPHQILKIKIPFKVERYDMIRRL